jgi:6-phosphofructokinase 1
MDTIHRIEKYARLNDYELFGVGVPKTVDNDLFGTDHTPGFPSAARYVALSVQQGARLANDMQRVDKFVVHQTVGRDAGWLASASAAAKRNDGDAPHLILVPERPISSNALLDRAQRAIDRFGWVYIVVGEGALWDNGVPISASMTKDQFANIEFGAMGGSSAALQVHALLSRELNVRGEFQITESLPMCASDRVSAVDRNEAYQCGTRAMEMATSLQSGTMVTIERDADAPYRADFGTIALSDVAERTRPMPDEFFGESGTDVSQLYSTYLEPLIGPLPTFADLRSE